MTFPNNTPGDDNFPGFVLSQRIAFAWITAMTAHAEQANDIWSHFRRGQVTVGDLAQRWARIVEAYAGAAKTSVAAVSGIGQPTQPAWLFVPYSLTTPPAPSQSVRLPDSVRSKDGLQLTPFQTFGGTPVWDVLTDPLAIEGGRLLLRLNQKGLGGLVPGTTLISLLYHAGHGPTSPLAVIVIRIID